MKQLTIRDNILRDCAASGPVTFAELQASAKAQGFGTANTSGLQLEIVRALNDLARKGKIELYDTGDSWICCVERTP
jgi:hypothetical protein